MQNIYEQEKNKELKKKDLENIKFNYYHSTQLHEFFVHKYLEKHHIRPAKRGYLKIALMRFSDKKRCRSRNCRNAVQEFTAQHLIFGGR